MVLYLHTCLSTHIKPLLGTAFWINGAHNLVLHAVEETLKFVIQMKRTRKYFCICGRKAWRNYYAWIPWSPSLCWWCLYKYAVSQRNTSSFDFTLILYRLFVLDITLYLGKNLIRNTDKGANSQFVFTADIY